MNGEDPTGIRLRLTTVTILALVTICSTSSTTSAGGRMARRYRRIELLPCPCVCLPADECCPRGTLNPPLTSTVLPESQATLPFAEPAKPVLQPLGLDGEWLSPEHHYAFRLSGSKGVATLPNSNKYQTGQVMLQAESVYGTSFRGKQLFTDGEFVAVVGRLISDHELEMSGLGITWTMLRVAPGALTKFQGEWFSPEHRYAFDLKGSDGTATQSNSEKYRAGQTMIQIASADGTTFYGRQLFTDGEYHPVSGRLNSAGELEMTGSGANWKMIRR